MFRPFAVIVIFLAASLCAREVVQSPTSNAGSVPSAKAVSTIPNDPTSLKWDAETKEANPKPGDVSAEFTFTVTNVSDHEVLLNKLRTSCGCTVAQLPAAPYKLKPGSNVSLAVTLDLRGKSGMLTKTVTVESSAGAKSLIVRANIPQAAPIAALSTPVSALGTNAVSAPGIARVPNAAMDRAMNIQNALADRQAIFKGECATCHMDKGVGKMGAELYAASCGICHEAEHRATMVPDLRVPRSPRDLGFWQKWIDEGKPGTLMPAFAAEHGGPFTREQGDSLAAFLDQNFSGKPQTAAIAPTQTAAP